MADDEQTQAEHGEALAGLVKSTRAYLLRTSEWLLGRRLDEDGPITTRQLLLAVIAALVAGTILAQLLIPRPAVGIIRLQSDIWSTGDQVDSVDLVQAQIHAARDDPSIKAVVLHLDSPGGEVDATQVLYLELLDLRQEMPVVTSIEGMAASGGYYIAMASDPIFAKPSSSVGNVGVWGFIPPDISVNDTILASGPFKLTGNSRAEFLRSIEGIKQEFLASVLANRGDRLHISTAELSQGLVYRGREAVALGLIDDIGSRQDAIETAADLAGIANYDVVELLEPSRLELVDEGYLQPWPGAQDPETGERTLPPGAYLLYDIRLGAAP